MSINRVAALNDNLGFAKRQDSDFIRYAYWVSGPDTRHSALQQYDMLRTGYTRLFVLRMPKFIQELLPNETAIFRHMMHFSNVGIDGIQGYSVETTQATGGYAGASVEVPTGTKDDTTSITVKFYESQESLVRSYIDFWVTGMFDPQTGLNHYHGIRDILDNGSESGKRAAQMYQFSQVNHTMECLAVATDPSGEIPTYSCLLTNMFPKGSDHGHYNFDPGSHELVQISVEFACNKYMSHQINYLGKVALERFKIMKNFMLMYSGYNKSDIESELAKEADSVDEWFYNINTEGNTRGDKLPAYRTDSGWDLTTANAVYGTETQG